MKFIVRKAKLSDAKHIAIVHRSDNPYVTRFLMSGVDSPENLYRFGGAWMHEDSCAEHIMLFRVYGGEVFVAELDDRVVGHIEVIDDYNRRIGEYAYISVLVVHRGYRRRGIGRRLVRAVINYARDLGKDCVLVAAEEQSVGFYKKLGFEIEEVWLSVHIPAQKHGPIPQKIKKEEAVEEIVNNRYDPIIGRFHGTRMILFEFVMKYKTLEKLDMQHFFFKKSVGGCPIIVGVRKSKGIPNVAWIWGEEKIDIGEAIRLISNIAYYLGIPKVLTAIPEQQTTLEIVERITWMRKRLELNV